MRRSKAADSLLMLVAVLIGLGSAYQLARYPARLRATFGNSDLHLLQFSPDGSIVATADGYESPRTTVRLWNAATGDEQAALTTDLCPIYECMFSPNGRFLAIRNDYEGGFRLFDAVEGK